MQNFTIYGDKRSGNCLKILYVCRILGIEHAWHDVDILAGETRSDWFLGFNPVGQIPVVVFADGKVLAQSNAIMLYLSEGSALIPGDGFARAQMMEWLFWEQYTHEPQIAVRRFLKLYLGKSDEEIDPQLLKKGNRALKHMNNRLESHDWLVVMPSPMPICRLSPIPEWPVMVAMN
jgi:glutathione S-transferase